MLSALQWLLLHLPTGLVSFSANGNLDWLYQIQFSAAEDLWPLLYHCLHGAAFALQARPTQFSHMQYLFFGPTLDA